MDYIRRSEIGQRRTNGSLAHDATFLSVQLFAAIAITLASGFLPPGTPLANEMEATHPLV
jgi:hypothetical protein